MIPERFDMKKLFTKCENLPVQVKASFWFLICAFLQKGIAFITTPIFTRLLSTSEYGTYSVYNSWLGIIQVIVTLSLSSGVYVQGLVKFKDKRAEYTSALLGLTVALITTWYVIYFFTKSFWNRVLGLTTLQISLMFISIWVSAVFSFWSTSERVKFKYRKLVVITMIASILQPVISIILICHMEDKVTARILGIVIAQFLVYGHLFVEQMHLGKRFVDKKIWRYVLSFNIPLIPHYLSSTILNSADRIMISNMVDESKAGIYSLAYSVSMIMMVFNQSLLQTVEPWLYQKIDAKDFKNMPKLLYSTLSIIAAVNLLLILFAPEVISIFAPSSYYEAIYVIPPIAMSVFFAYMYAYFATFEFYYEKTKYITTATMTGAVANIILNYIFIKIFGYMAAGYTTLVCYMIYAAMHYIFMSEISKKELGDIKIYNIKIILAMSAVFLSLGFLILISYSNTYARYSLISIICILMLINKTKITKLVKSIMQLKRTN